MKLILVIPKTRTEDLLLSITKNCQTPIEHIHTKPQQTLEFNVTKPRKTFQFIAPISVEDCWMIGLINMEVYNSIFNITEENNKFELFTRSTNFHLKS